MAKWFYTIREYILPRNLVVVKTVVTVLASGLILIYMNNDPSFLFPLVLVLLMGGM